MATGRQTLTMAITLEGADKVETDLSKLGPAAEKAFAQIQKAAEKAGLSFDKKLGLAIVALRTKLAALQAAGARLGQSFNTFTLSVSTFGRAVANSAAKIGLITAAITGAIAAVTAFAKSGSDAAVQIDKQSKALGLTADQYQRLQTAAKNAELSQEQFEKVLTNFNLTADDTGDATDKAADGADKLAQSLRQVEITAEDGSKKLITVRGTSESFAKSIKSVGTAGKGTVTDLLAYARSIAALKTPQEQLDAVAARFGKRLALDTLPFLLDLAKGFDTTGDAARNLIAPLNDAEIAIGKQLDDALDDAGTNALRLKNRLALIFGPAVIEAARLFNKVIFDNQVRIQAFANFLATQGLQIVRDFFNALAGNDDQVQNKGILALRDGVIAFGTAVKSVVSDIIIPGFNRLIEILDSVAATINAVFGTEFTGKGILIAAVVAQMVGAFALLGSTLAIVAATVQLFTSAVVLMGTAFGPVVLGVGAVIAAIVALSTFMADLTGTPFPIALWITAGLAGSSTVVFLYWEDFKKMAVDAFDFINQKFSERSFGERFKDAALGPFQALWTLIKIGASGAFTFLEGVAERVINGIVSLVTSLISRVRDLIAALRQAASARESAGESGGGGGFAHGGSVRGPGSGTSDSIPAWLSDGEFVIRAAAVRKWGLGVFQALNGLRMPRGGFRLNMGGLAHAMAPRYATGGPVAAPQPSGGQGRAVVVNFGGESFEMSASDSVVRQLVKAATGKQIRSNGRKPAWYGA